MREHQGQQPKRRRETKKATYEWRTKGPVIPEAGNKEGMMNEGGNRINLNQTVTVQEKIQPCIPVEIQEHTHNQIEKDAGNTLTSTVDKGKKQVSPNLSLDNFPMLKPINNRSGSKTVAAGTS